MGRLDGKVAIVTGAARGTGAEIARQFDAEGALTTLVDVLDDRGEALADGAERPGALPAPRRHERGGVADRRRRDPRA